MCLFVYLYVLKDVLIGFRKGNRCFRSIPTTWDPWAPFASTPSAASWPKHGPPRQPLETNIDISMTFHDFERTFKRIFKGLSKDSKDLQRIFEGILREFKVFLVKFGNALEEGNPRWKTTAAAGGSAFSLRATSAGRKNFVRSKKA